MQIQVTEEIYELAKAGKIIMITSHLDPGADKALLEGAQPKTIQLKARGTRRKLLTFAVKSVSKVLKGYTVRSTQGKDLYTLIRTTGRVFIGPQVSIDEEETDTQSDLPDHEKPPE